MAIFTLEMGRKEIRSRLYDNADAAKEAALAMMKESGLPVIVIEFDDAKCPPQRLIESSWDVEAGQWIDEIIPAQENSE